MDVSPVVQYFILAEDFLANPTNPKKVSIIDVLVAIRPEQEPAYPMLVKEICCVIWLTDGRRSGESQIVCVDDETSRPLFASSLHTIQLSHDPLEYFVAGFRMLDCRFPRPGVYNFEFRWNKTKIAECPLRLR
ncbi:MAG: hypothetical protein ACR2FY_17650 [Pirellulaceae bacterium]